MFCVKMFHAETMSEKDKQDAQNEAKLLATLSHPNIVSYEETYTVQTICSVALLSTYTTTSAEVHRRSGQATTAAIQVLCAWHANTHSTEPGMSHPHTQTSGGELCATVCRTIETGG